MKDSVYRARCIDKVLSKHSTFEVMEGLADVALDLFQLGLRDQGESASREQVRRQIRKLDRWKRNTSRN
jgi:hypothetical protein